MDVMVTGKLDRDLIGVFVNWGGYQQLNCTQNGSDPIVKMRGEPMVLVRFKL